MNQVFWVLQATLFDTEESDTCQQSYPSSVQIQIALFDFRYTSSQWMGFSSNTHKIFPYVYLNSICIHSWNFLISKVKFSLLSIDRQKTFNILLVRSNILFSSNPPSQAIKADCRPTRLPLYQQRFPASPKPFFCRCSHGRQGQLDSSPHAILGTPSLQRFR